MPKGNSFDPFTHGGIDWAGNSASNSVGGFMRSHDGDNPADSWGPDDACYYDHIDKKSNRRPDKESKYNTEKTVVDGPLWASDARIKKTSAQQYSSNHYKDDTK